MDNVALIMCICTVYVCMYYMYLSNSDASNFHEVLGSLNSTEYLSSSAYKNKEKGTERGRERDICY